MTTSWNTNKLSCVHLFLFFWHSNLSKESNSSSTSTSSAPMRLPTADRNEYFDCLFLTFDFHLVGMIRNSCWYTLHIRNSKSTFEIVRSYGAVCESRCRENARKRQTRTLAIRKTKIKSIISIIQLIRCEVEGTSSSTRHCHRSTHRYQRTQFESKLSVFASFFFYTIFVCSKRFARKRSMAK